MRRHYIPLSLSYVFKIKQAGEQLLCVNFQDKRLNGKPTTCLVRQYVRGTHMLFYIIGFAITSQTTQLAVVQVHNVLINGRNGSVCNDASYSTLQVKKRASDKTSKGRQVHTVLYGASSWMSAHRTDRSLDLQLSEFQSHVKLKLASSPLFSVPCTWLVYQRETNNTAGLIALRFFVAFSQPIHTLVIFHYLIHGSLVLLTEFLVPIPKPTVSLQLASPISHLFSTSPQNLASLHQPVIILALNIVAKRKSNYPTCRRTYVQSIRIVPTQKLGFFLQILVRVPTK